MEKPLQIKISLACFLPHFLFIPFFGIGLLTIWYPIFTLFTSKLFLYEKRIEGTTGFFQTKFLETPIKRIQSMEINQTIFGRIFHYGTITFFTCNQKYSFYYRKNLKQVQTYLIEKM